MAVAGSSSVEMLSDIFKMNIDCFEELFEWLSMADILALRLTCKRFKQIVDFYIKTYTHHIKCQLNDTNFECFHRMDAGSIEVIKEIEVSARQGFDATQFSLIKDLLSKVPNICIKNWNNDSDSDYYNTFPKYCKNLKYLTVSDVSCPQNSDEWLSHQYPSLEYIGFNCTLKTRIDEHSSVVGQSSISCRIESQFVAAGRKFDRLFTWAYELEGYVDLLKSLYHEQFYRRLYLDFDDYPENEDSFQKLASCGIEAMSSEYLNFTIPPIPGLKELQFDQTCEFDEGNLENVKNVAERINFAC